MSFVTKAVGGIFEGLGLIDKPSSPVALAPAPTLSSQSVQDAAEEERKKAALMRGRASTVLTQPLGQTQDATSASKTLFGA
jgi:hypothetical protein